MPAATSRLNQTEIIRSFTLTALIIIMDMSGFAGLAAEERLEEEPTEFNTLSNLNLPGFQAGLANMSQRILYEQPTIIYFKFFSKQRCAKEGRQMQVGFYL